MHGQALGNLMEFGRVGLVSCHEIRGLTNATGVILCTVLSGL